MEVVSRMSALSILLSRHKLWSLLFNFFESFSHQCQLMVFRRSLSDRKSPQVSRTRLNILTNLKNAVLCMLSSYPPISKSSSPCSNPLVTVPSAPITFGITFMVLFFQYSCKVWVFISLFAFFQFYLVVSRNGKVHNWQILYFCQLSIGLVIWLRLGDPFVSQNPREVCASHFLGRCAYNICFSVSYTIHNGLPSPT